MLSLVFGVHASPQEVGEVGGWCVYNIYNEGHKQNKHHIAKVGHLSEFAYKDITNEWRFQN